VLLLVRRRPCGSTTGSSSSNKFVTDGRSRWPDSPKPRTATCPTPTSTASNYSAAARFSDSTCFQHPHAMAADRRRSQERLSDGREDTIFFLFFHGSLTVWLLGSSSMTNDGARVRRGVDAIDQSKPHFNFPIATCVRVAVVSMTCDLVVFLLL
jgi:hypothetical protein